MPWLFVLPKEEQVSLFAKAVRASRGSVILTQVLLARAEVVDLLPGGAGVNLNLL